MQIFSKKIFLLVLFIFLLFIAGAIIFKLNSKTEKTYSTILFSSSRVQILNLPSKLTGKSIPNTKVELFITPGLHKAEVRTDKENGEWNYVVLNSITPGKYRLTLQLFDGREKLSLIRSYPIEIKQPSYLEKIHQLLPKKVSAQESLTPDEEAWVIQMRKLGVWPAKENGEFILYSEEEYDKRYCPYPCAKLKPQQRLGKQIQQAARAKQLNITQELIKKLQLKGYAPLAVLTPYIPELENDDYQKQFGITRAYALNAKTEISETELKEILNEVISQQIDYQLKGGDVRALIDMAGAGTVLDVLSKEKKLQYLDSEEFIDFILGLAILYEPVSGGARVGAAGVKGGVKITAEIIEDMPVILRMIRSGNPVPTKVIKSRSLVKVLNEETFDEIISRSSRWAKEFDNLPEAAVYDLKGLTGMDISYLRPDSYNGQYWFDLMIKPALESKQASQISQDYVLYSASQKVLDRVIEFYSRKGIPFEASSKFNITSYYGKAFVVDDELFIKAWGEYLSLRGRTSSASRWEIPGAFTVDDLIVLRRSTYESPDGLLTLYHELIHTIGSERTFTYGASDDLNKALSMIYELSTDIWVNPIFGTPVNSTTPLYAGGYAATNPEISYAILQRIMVGYEKRGINISDTLLDFAIRGDSADLIKALTGKTGKVGEETLLKTLDAFGIRYKNVVFTKNLLVPVGLAGSYGALGAGVYSQREDLSSGIDQAGEIIRTKRDQLLHFINIKLTPAVDVSNDVLSNDYDPALPFKPFGEIIITKVEGNFYPGGELHTSSIVSEFGEVDNNPDEYNKIWGLKPIPQHSGMGLIPVKNTYAQENNLNTISYGEIEPLKGGEDCFDNCQLTLPINIQPVEYQLVVYLADKESKKIIDSDFYPIEIKKALRQIESFTINDQSYTKEDVKNGFKLPLNADPAQPQLVNLPVTIRFTDGSSRYLVLNINYQPKITATPLPETTTEPESTSQPAPTEEPAASECHEEARDLGEGVARNYRVCNDGSEQPSGEEYCINGSDDAECRLKQQ